MKFYTAVVAVCIFAFVNSVQAQATAQNHTYHQSSNKSQAVATSNAKPKPFNNTMCPVSDEPIAAGGGKKVVHKGYEINLCCGGCVKKFNKNPDAYLDAMLKAEQAKAAQGQVAAANVKPINNPNCPVSGHPVGSMQKGSNVVYKGYQVGLCCDGCIGRFNQNADAYLQALLKPKS